MGRPQRPAHQSELIIRERPLLPAQRCVIRRGLDKDLLPQSPVGVGDSWGSVFFMGVVALMKPANNIMAPKNSP